MCHIHKAVIVCFALAATTIPTPAEEDGLGRTLPGVWIMPQAGVVGPDAGFSFTTLPIGYMGAIGGGRLVPEAGSLFSNVDANISTNYVVPQYVYKTESSKVSLASSALVPISWAGATGSLQFNNTSLSTSSANAGLGDFIFVPLAVGIHFSENSNLAISTYIFAPTGHFSPAYLTNLGMNEWTVMPNLAYTYLSKRGLELDSLVGLDIYSENLTTRYRSGTMFHWDGMAIQYLSKRVGLGAIGSNLTQLNKDTGPFATLLHGFEGRAWGVGPIVLWVAKLENPGVVLQLRWVNEFEVTNLLKGNVFMAGVTLKMK